MASVDPPLIVVTTVAEDGRAGCLVGFHAQSSITPGALLHLAVQGQPHLPGQPARRALRRPLPDSEDLPLAELFGTISGEDTDKFAGLDVDLDPTAYRC